MITFGIRNKGMGELSYGVLLHTAKRVLEMRGLSLTDSNADYTVDVSVDAELKNDRYIITTTEKGASIVAANDCSVHGAFGKIRHLTVKAVLFAQKKGSLTSLRQRNCAVCILPHIIIISTM